MVPDPQNHVLDLALGRRAHNMCEVMGSNGAAPLRREAPGWTTVAAARLVQPCGHGFYYRAVGVVIFESPNERTT